MDSVLTVLSSTAVYIVAILQMMNETSSVYWTSPWLNMWVFPVNADSIFNDIGMTLLSGMARSFVLEAPHLSSRHSSMNRTRVKVEPELLNAAGEAVIDSRAYD